MRGRSQSTPWNTGGWLGVRSVVMLACLSASVDGQKYLKSYNKSNSGTKALYAFLGSLSLSLIIFSCYFCWKRVFPSNNEFLSLDLDDIRLERIDEREQFLQREMTGIQNKLTSYRRKKTDILIKKDVTRHLEENLDKYNDKGSRIYGDQWDSGTGGIKEMMSLPDGEARQLQIEAQNIVTQRKAEEERDLWHLWNTAKTGAASAMGTIKGGMGGGKTDKKTDVGSEVRGADVMTDRVPTGRKSQATAIGAAAVAAGRTTRSAAAAGGGGDPRFSSGAVSARSSGPSGPSGDDDDTYVAYGKKTAPTPPLDLSKISFPPSGVQRPGRGSSSGGGGGGSSTSVSNSGPDPFSHSGGDNYNMDLGFTPQSQQRAAPLRSTGASASSSSSAATAAGRAGAGGRGSKQLPSMARRPEPPPINPMHSSSSPLEKLDQTHAAFTSGGAGRVWGGAGSPGPAAVLKPPPGVRAPGGPGGRPPPRGPPGMQLARPGFGTPGRGRPRPPPPRAGMPPRGTPRGPPPRAPSNIGGPLSPPQGVRGPPPRL